jgi:uncharacterized repeat protein (TIGR03803 family)
MIKISNPRPLGALAVAGIAASLAACSGTPTNTSNVLPAARSSTPSAVARSRDASFEMLYAFSGQKDGANPDGGLVADASGALYGTTCAGGKDGFGNVYKVVASGSGYKLSTIYSFRGGNDGICPAYSLIRDGQGALYGVTAEGGGLNNYGTIFKLTPTGSGYKETVLHAFEDISEGRLPQQVMLAGDGALYGMTQEGGSGAACAPYCGTVYKLVPHGNRFKLTTLHQFQGGADDGDQPGGNLVFGNDGRLYGTTKYGGNSTCGCGVIFALDLGGKETVLHDFAGGQDGMNPTAGLTLDAKGRLYGTTYAGGGGTSSLCRGVGCGTVFGIGKNGSRYALLFAFTQQQQGFDPNASVAIDSNGTIYGTTYNGGSDGCGVLYELHKHGKSTYKQTILHEFAGGASDGRAPYSTPLLIDTTLYGTTQFGGPVDSGTIFKARP